MGLLSRTRKGQQGAPTVVNQFRTSVFYAPVGPDAVAIISAMGFGTLAEATEHQSELAKGLVNIARALACDSSQEPASLMVFGALDGSGRLLVVFPTDPAIVIAQIGPPVVRPETPAEETAQLTGLEGEPRVKVIQATPRGPKLVGRRLVN
jgi:hypothetical protein